MVARIAEVRQQDYTTADREMDKDFWAGCVKEFTLGFSGILSAREKQDKNVARE